MLETERLILIPLDERQLELWYTNLAELEKELGCEYRAEPLAGPFQAIVKEQLDMMKKDFDNYLWHTFWFLKDKESAVIVGAADFKGAPANSQVEIGYAAGEAYRKRGYMTEAIRTMCDWALRQSGVKTVVAETDKQNGDSHKVLSKCGFIKCGDGDGDTFWWKLEKPL